MGRDRSGSMDQDFVDRIGRRVSAVFVALLLAFFAYAYLHPFFG